MRRLIITENVTLDGVIDATEGWLSPSGDDDADESELIEARPFRNGVVLLRHRPA